MGRLFQKLRRDFLTGLVVLIPIVLTVYLVWSVISFIDKVVIPIIPPKYNPLDVFEVYIPGLGVFLFLIATTLIGSLASGFLGSCLEYLKNTAKSLEEINIKDKEISNLMKILK